MFTRPALLAASALVAAAAVPAAASAAPSISLNHSCYVMAGQDSQLITATMVGLDPNESISVRISQAGLTGGIGDALTADAGGTLVNGLDQWEFDIPSGPGREKPATVQAVDATTGSVVATAKTSVANFEYSVVSKGHTHHWKIQGLKALTGSGTYWAHYFKGTKYKGKMKLGTAKGPCGYLSITTQRLTPFAKLGEYNMVIESSSHYSPDVPQFTGQIVVTHG